MPHSDLEPDLIQRAIAGDRAALSQQLLIHHDALRRHIVHESAGRQLGVVLADDILQQTFVRAAQSIKTFEVRELGSLHGWLKTIATNLIKDARKRRGRERRATSPYAAHSDDGLFLQAVERLACDRTPPIKRVQRSGANADTGKRRDKPAWSREPRSEGVAARERPSQIELFDLSHFHFPEFFSRIMIDISLARRMIITASCQAA